MKRFLLSVVLATTLALTSCQFDDSDIWGKLDEYGESIRDHEQRISALEELCKQMNTNIEALQTLVDALEKRDYVTNVSEVRSNGEVIGYTISFAYSDTITIYHGKNGADGQDGANGKDGYTPQIGVMKDVDGVYYWTLDGEWLLDAKGNKIKAVGVDGKDGQDGTNGSNGSNGTDGEDGTNGTNGKDGADGITPRLKIENDYWYVSYDNGATWEQLGKATGEDGKDGNDGQNGSDGVDGEDGDSIFKSVTQDDEYVYFNLADGTMITLPKHDKENIQFEDLQVKAICCKNWDTNNDGELSYAEAAAVETIGTTFRGKTVIIAFTELKYFTGITEIPANAFNGCTALWKIKIPENVLTIGSSAFNGCIGISNIVLPNGVTTIGDNAFYGCTALLNITLPQNLDSIGSYAFSNCTSLSEVNLPDCLTSIEMGTFYYCSSLSSIIIPENVTSIRDKAFMGCSSIKTIFCKPKTPPAIYATNSPNSSNAASLPYNSGMKIYVPINCYNNYVKYSNNSSSLSSENWSKYESYVEELPYTPTECTLLTITADNVDWDATSTLIYYTAVTNGISPIFDKPLTNVSIDGIASSNTFEQNTSLTNSVEHTITYSYLGQTATTTIIQGKYEPKLYTVNLNNQWRLSSSVANPDAIVYDGVYESYSNRGQNSSSATMSIDINGYTEFSIYVRSYGEDDEDYVIVYDLDSTSSVKTASRVSRSGSTIDNYTKVSFTNIDKGSHRITIKYSKDVSASEGADSGYVLIPKKQ